MEIKRGSVVIARAGRDKGGLFVVIRASEEYVEIVDGKRRTLEKPKKKKRKHLSVTAEKLVEDKMITDRGIRKALREFK